MPKAKKTKQLKQQEKTKTKKPARVPAPSEQKKKP